MRSSSSLTSSFFRSRSYFTAAGVMICNIIIIVLLLSFINISSVQGFIIISPATTSTTSTIIPTTRTKTSTTSQKNHQNHHHTLSSLNLYYYQDGDDVVGSTTEDYDNDLLYNNYSLEEYERRNQHRTEQIANSFLKSSRSSFKNMESGVDGLLENQPLVALSVFVGCGLLVAYLTGFFLLGGYIENINPAENGHMPDWDEGILIIEPYPNKNVGSV